MARWTVVDGDQTFVIESTDTETVSLDVLPKSPFVTNADGIRDLRLKLGMAIGEAQAVGAANPDLAAPTGQPGQPGGSG